VTPIKSSNNFFYFWSGWAPNMTGSHSTAVAATTVVTPLAMHKCWVTRPPLSNSCVIIP